MKKILLLDTGNEWGGGTNSMIELLKRIDRSRFEVHALFYRNYAKGTQSDLRAELAAIGIPLEVLPPLKRPWWTKLANEMLRGLLFWDERRRKAAIRRIDDIWRTRPRAQQIARRLRDGGFDLLYLNNQPSSNREGYLAAALARVASIQHCRIDVSLTPKETELANRIARRIICVSDDVAQSLLAQGVRRDLLTVVHNAIDVEQALPQQVKPESVAHGSIVVGTVGQLVARKAVHHLLEAAARVVSNGSLQLHLLVVGDGPEAETLQARARELGLAEHVQFAGFQPQPLPWIAAMDIVVLASEKEGLPRVLLEAMLLSKPVIASAVVGSKELVVDGDTGLLYPFGDIDRLAQAMATLAADPALRIRMGVQGRKRVESCYSIRRYVEGVQAVFQEVLA